jgi:hypothetical protein
MLSRTVLIAMAHLVLAAAAQATITDIHWTSLDGDPAVVGSVQNTLYTSMTNDWTNAVITIQLTAGSLLNPTVSGTTNEWQQLGGPNDSWLAVPYVAGGGFPTINLFDQDSPLVPGVDHTYDWFDIANGGATNNGIAARIYATDTAAGTFRVEMYDRDSAGMPTLLSGNITNGNFAAPMVLAGDYNGNGTVDAADYTLWRNNFGAAAGTLPNDVDGGAIGSAQYATWKTHFGMTNTGAAALQSNAVPEPAAAILMFVAMTGSSLCRQRRRTPVRSA